MKRKWRRNNGRGKVLIHTHPQNRPKHGVHNPKLAKQPPLILSLSNPLSSDPSRVVPHFKRPFNLLPRLLRHRYIARIPRHEIRIIAVSYRCKARMHFIRGTARKSSQDGVAGPEGVLGVAFGEVLEDGEGVCY